MMAGKQESLGRVAIIGLGLIGGSIGKGLMERGLAGSVFAYDKNLESSNEGLILGAASGACRTMKEALEGADLLVLAVPVGAMPPILEELAGLLEAARNEKESRINPNLVITDTGSVKSSVIAAAWGVFGKLPPNLVPGHPIAGSERHGVAAANGALFENHKVILTPEEGTTDPAAINKVRQLWQGLGAEVLEMPAARHDALLAQTSHLPHLLAYALVDTLSSHSPDSFSYAAGGFRDFTRIAASDPVMWRDIFAANGDQVLDILDKYMNELDELRGLIEKGDAEGLHEIFQRASAARNQLGQNQGQP